MNRRFFLLLLVVIVLFSAICGGEAYLKSFQKEKMFTEAVKEYYTPEHEEMTKELPNAELDENGDSVWKADFLN